MAVNGIVVRDESFPSPPFENARRERTLRQRADNVPSSGLSS